MNEEEDGGGRGGRGDDEGRSWKMTMTMRMRIRRRIEEEPSGAMLPGKRYRSLQNALHWHGQVQTYSLDIETKNIPQICFFLRIYIFTRGSTRTMPTTCQSSVCANNPIRNSHHNHHHHFSVPLPPPPSSSSLSSFLLVIIIILRTQDA